ncbi:MAG: hypothetical protein CMN74_10420 [Sphingorhabdus sp.]|nr:hypothetical protein [Sphingorhabdus sp.]
MPLWRYMDLPKFLSLLLDKALWLPNANLLAKDDPYEGALWDKNFIHRTWRSMGDVPETFKAFLNLNHRESDEESDEKVFMRYMRTIEQVVHISKSARSSFYVNCWHGARQESAAMWKIYGSPGPGVALISDVDRIENSLVPDGKQLYCGQVNYLDDTEPLDWSNGFNIIMSKRRCFSYENEVRIVYWGRGDQFEEIDLNLWDEERLRFNFSGFVKKTSQAGVQVDCDLNKLINEVMISPYAPKWYMGIIEKLRDVHKLNFKITSSRLLAEPSAPA